MKASKRRLVVAAKKKALRERADLPRGVPYARYERMRVLKLEKEKRREVNKLDAPSSLGTAQ